MENQESCGVGCYLCGHLHIKNLTLHEACAVAACLETHKEEKYIDLLHTHFVVAVAVEASSVFEL